MEEKKETLKEEKKLLEDEKEALGEEKEALETGGGVKNALPLLEGQAFFVSNSDVFFIDKGYKPALWKMIDKWDEEKYFALLEKFSLPRKKIIKNFSRGMKVKLSIAVALSHNAKLLILDEPTNGLDPVIRNEIVDIFYEFTRNPLNSVLISSHIVSDLEKLCDYIAFLHKGKLVLCEEKDRLLEKYGIIHCSATEFEKIEPSAVKSKKESPYGVEAVVERRSVSADTEISPVGVEELFVVLMREEK